MPQFLWSDAWLLTSIYGASLGGEPTLSRIIGTGDFINRAIFTHSELNGGMSRLQRGGLIEAEGDCYRLTDAGVRITEIDPKAKKGPFYHMETVRKRLEASDWGPRVDPNACDDPERVIEHVSEAELKKAFEDYSNSLKRRNKPKANKPAHDNP